MRLVTTHRGWSAHEIQVGPIVFIRRHQPAHGRRWIVCRDRFWRY